MHTELTTLVAAILDKDNPDCWSKETYKNYNIERVKLVLKNSTYADINYPGQYGWTPLIYACEHYIRVEVVKLLLEKGADVNLANDAGDTPLIYLCSLCPSWCRKERHELVKLLLEKGADVNHENNDGRTALWFACEWSDYPEYFETVKLLIENGADINHRHNASNDPGGTAFTCTCVNGNYETAKLLLDKGADINHKTNDGKTALDLTLAFKYGSRARNRKTIKILILYEMKFKELIKKNSNELIDIYEILINKINEKPLDKEIVDITNPLDIAIRKENKELVKILTLREMKFKEVIDIYEILINEIKERAIVKEIINMKHQLEFL